MMVMLYSTITNIYFYIIEYILTLFDII